MEVDVIPPLDSDMEWSDEDLRTAWCFFLFSVWDVGSHSLGMATDGSLGMA